MNVDSAEYANIVLELHALLRPGAPRRDGAAAGRAQAADRPVDRARAGRLLDARRLHELGLRPRLQALAPGQEARAHAAGADRDRVRAVAAAGRTLGRAGRSTCSTAASSSTTAPRSATAASPTRCSSTSTPSRRSAASARLAAARMQANAARAVEAGLGRRSAARAAGAVRLRPRHRPPGGHDARVQHRDRRRQPARVPVRRDRPRAAVRRPARRSRATIGGTPPATLRRDRARRHGRRVLASQVGRGVGRPRRHAAAADQGAARRRPRGRRRRPGARSPARSRTCARPGRSAAARPRSASRHRFTPGSIQTRWDVARRATNAAYSVDVLFPSTGRGAGAGSPRCCATARG